MVVGGSAVAGGLVPVLGGGDACWVAGGGCETTLVAGGRGEVAVVLVPAVVAFSSEPNAIASRVPTSTLATMVPAIATVGRRYQRMTGFSGSGGGLSGCSKFDAGSVDGSPPVRAQASAGIMPGARTACAVEVVEVVTVRLRFDGHAGAVAVTDAAAITAVAPLSAEPGITFNAPPTAAVSCGRGVVTTGTRRCPDSVVVTTGMFAPPPTETTATRSRIPLRCNVSSSNATKLFSDSRIASSSSSLVSRISPRTPVKSSVNVVTVLDESCSLALRQAARSRLSEPIAEVPNGSNGPVLEILAITAVNNAWSIMSPEKSRCRTVGATARQSPAASINVMVVPLPPKSHTATVPRAGRPGLARMAKSAAAASGISVSGCARFDHSDTWLTAAPRASTDLDGQCAG